MNVRFAQAKKAGVFDGALQMIDDYTELYKDHFARNFKRWPDSMGTRTDVFHVDVIMSFQTQADASAYLKAWLTERIDNYGALIKKKC